MAKFKSTYAKAQAIKEIVNQYYEPGRQDRCKRWVYLNIVRKQYAISERTYFRLLNLEEPKEEKIDDRQLSLFDS